jgi:hypothetical protein
VKLSNRRRQLKASRPTVSGVPLKYGSVNEMMMFRRTEPTSAFRSRRWPRPNRLFSWMRTLKSRLSAELNPAPALNAPVCASFTSTTTCILSSVEAFRVVMLTSEKKPRRWSASRLLRRRVPEKSSPS